MLYKLDPFLDEYGLLRVGERLRQSSVPYEVKHPVILPKKGHVMSLILSHYHKSVQHQGRGITQNEVRASGFWIIGGSSVVSNHISKCVSLQTSSEPYFAVASRRERRPGSPHLRSHLKNCMGL